MFEKVSPWVENDLDAMYIRRRALRRLERIEQAAQALVAHEFVSETEWNNGWKAHKAETIKLLEALRSALDEGGGS